MVAGVGAGVSVGIEAGESVGVFCEEASWESPAVKVVLAFSLTGKDPEASCVEGVGGLSDAPLPLPLPRPVRPPLEPFGGIAYRTNWLIWSVVVS